MTVSKLTRKQRQAIKALIEGKNYEETALVAGVTNRTLWTWRHDNETFKAELARQSDNVLSDATTTMKANMHTAVNVISEVMCDREASPSVRVRAAQAMLETGLKLIDAAEILKRIAVLEQAVQ